MTTELDPKLVAEVLRVHQRYVIEVVEAFDLCPFARHARLTGRIHNLVLPFAEAEVGETTAVIDALAAGSPDADLVELIFPRLCVSPSDLEWFLAAVRKLHAEHAGGRPVFVMASFHPDYRLALGSPEQLVAFLRRTPDPTLQLLRHSRLAKLREEASRGTTFFDPRTMRVDAPKEPEPLDLSEKIARDNFAAVSRLGPERIEKILADIRDDRDRSYARFSASPR